MRRSIWLHQFTQTAEQTPQQFADTLLPRGITAIYVKALDGPYWMGDVYNHPLVPRDTASMAVLCDRFEAVGLELIPWVVSRRSADEARSHVDCGTAANGKLIVDWEYHYAGFWEGTLADAQEYHDTLQAAVQAGLWVASAPDPRQVQRDYSRTLITGLSAYLPQCYWTDFQRPAIEVLRSAAMNMAGLDPFEPILPYNASAEDMATALQWCQQQGCPGVSLWLMGHADARQLDAFAQRVDGEQDPATPETYEPTAAEFRQALSYLSHDVMQPLRSYKLGKVKAAVAEVARVAQQYGADV